MNANSVATNIEPLALRREDAAKLLSISVVGLWRLEKRQLIRPVPGTGSGNGRVKLYAMEELRRFTREGCSGLKISA